MHAIVDGLGNPVYFQLSSGNVNDNTLAVEVLSHV
ncbi:MAG: family transposase, partial [Anaerocolumna sp.]|nr:family transposase [Anaerocolumna sp.]